MSPKRSEEPEDVSREESAKRRHLQDPAVTEEPQTSQSDHPPQTEGDSNVTPDINVDSIEVFLRLTERFYEKKESEQKKTEAEIKKLEDKEEATREEHNKRIEMFKAQDCLTEILQENQSFDRTIKNLDEEQREIRKTGRDTIKRLEDEQQKVKTSFSKTLKGLKDALKESKIKEEHREEELKMKEEHREEWLEAKRLNYFMSKIKDPETLFSEIKDTERMIPYLFGDEKAIKSYKVIIGCLKYFLREYNWSAMPSVCSILFQLPIFVFQMTLPALEENSSNVRYQTPTGSASSEYKNAKFDLIPFEMNIVDADLVTEFQNPGPELLDIFVSLLTTIPQPKEGMNEWESSSINHHIINHLTQLVDITKETNIQVSPQAIVRSVNNQIHVTPDISMFLENIKFLIMECKPFPLITKEMRTNNDILKKELNHRLKPSLRQLIIALIEAKCPMGILSDWCTSILIEINLEDFEKNKDKYGTESPPKIPINFKVIEFNSVRPSYLQVLYYFICRAMKTQEENVEKMTRLDIKSFLMNKGQTEKLNVPRTHPPRSQEPGDSEVKIVLQKRKETQPVMSPLNVIPLFGPVTYVDLEDDDFIQSGGACYQVFKTKAKHFSSVITQELDPEEIIVGKILGPSAWDDEKHCDLDRKKIDAENHYQMERKCITELMAVEEFNNCFIKHKEVRATIVIPEWAYDRDDKPVDKYISGKCILSKYIDSDPYNEETYEKALQQLEVIHDRKIFHKDVADRNILYKDGKVYFIDFGRSTFSNEEDAYQIDKDDLWNCFHTSESEED